MCACFPVKLLSQTFVGLTALLAAFPPCLGTGDPKELQPTHPLLSGSVCRVRDTLDFLDVSARILYLLVLSLQILLLLLLLL